MFLSPLLVPFYLSWNIISVYENNIHNCQYFDEDEINKKFNSILTEQFSILSLNIQSLPGKFNEFQTFFASTMGKFKPSVIAL